MKKVLLIGAIAALVAWIYTDGSRQFHDRVIAASKTDIFN